MSRRRKHARTAARTATPTATDPRTVRAAATPFRIAGAGETPEIQAADGEGKAPTFKGVVYTGGQLRLGNFALPVVVDLAQTTAPRQEAPVLREHDVERIVGHTTEIEITAQRIRAQGVFSSDGEDAQQVVALGKKSFPWQMSLGADAANFERISDGEKVTVNGRSFKGPILVARGAVVREVSFVALGADAATSAGVAAQRGGDTSMNFEQWLQSKAFDPAALSEGQKAVLKAAYDAEQKPPAPVVQAGTQTATATRPAETQTLDDIVAAARAEEERKTKVTEIVARFIQENPSQLELAEALGRQAIEGKWKVDRLELELLRERRTTGVSTIARSYQPEVTEAVIEASVCRAGGLRDLEKTYDERTLEASDRHFKHGMGLADLVMTFARRNGFAGTSVKSNLAGALRAAFSPEIKAAGAWGPSTGGGLSGILSNVANKFLRDGFNSVDSTWRQFAAVRSVNDFKQISTYSLTGGLTFDKVPAGGEIKHGQIAAETYTNQVDTYAKMLGLDRRDLINDDLGALTNVSRRLGRGGALKLNDVIWTVFLNNSAFFTSGRLNVSTGGGSALSLAGLDAANAKFLTQTDPDGNPMGATPKILLVPPALWSTAQTLMSSTALVSGATTTPGTPSNNVWAGMFRVVTSPYMQNSNYTGYSAAAWYLLADPNDIPVIEVAFLNGQEAPTVESADADFGMLGVAFRGFHDFGASLQEYRAGVRSAGS